jgi:antitoxin YefM
MQAVTFNEAAQNFAMLADEVIDNREPLIVTRENNKAFVMISLDDFNAWQETEYLMRSPANARDLLQAVEDVKARKNVFKKDLIDI